MIDISNEETLNRTYDFLRYHENDTDERQQAQMWIRDFLEIFDIPRQKINIGFEWRVNIDGSQKYADHLLNGVLLIEMKSRNKKLDKAKSQAYRYVMNLEKADTPKFVLLCNFERIQLLDLMNLENSWDFKVADLPKHLDKFGFLVNKVIDVHVPSNPVNEKAAKNMEILHTKLLESKYPRNFADLLMTRVVFCLFAEDSGIFNQNQFSNYLKNETREDGSDLVDRLSTLFQVMNTPEEKRFQSKVLQDFPYINGGLFELPQLTGLPLTSEIRNHLIESTDLDWSKISPVIFGSMFEGAMDEKRRHSLGAHYTSEKNIMKVVSSMFLDDLQEEFEHIRSLKRAREKRLQEFHDKLSNLKFFDPACGSGNFLIVGYREIRRLEHEVIDEIVQGQTVLEISDYIKVEVNQFYGLEIVPYAVSIAKVGLWLMDHLMNVEASELFGRLYLRLPLHAGANIHNENALTYDWRNIIPTKEVNYIFGNPPFIGRGVMTPEQKQEIKLVAKDYPRSGNLDYVAGWFIKCAELLQENNSIKCALVATSSIAQGEQSITLWQKLFSKGVKMNFAHRTFKWDNNGASVYVVIIGFSLTENNNKKIFHYLPQTSDLGKVENVVSINEYLLPGEMVGLKFRSKPISNVPQMTFGSHAVDGKGGFSITNDEKDMLIKKYGEKIQPYIFNWIGATEFTNNKNRNILYLKNMSIREMRSMPEVMQHIQFVKDFRASSKNAEIREKANYPTEFFRDRVKEGKLLIIPVTTTGRREIIPIGYAKDNTIVSHAMFQIPDGDLFIFGVFESAIHMAWTNVVGGRLKEDFRYSNTLVYNNFVFPNTNEIQKGKIIKLSEDILTIRQTYFSKGDTIADIYDPLTMPSELKKAHEKLNQEVDRLYRKEPFTSDEERVQHLIKLYRKTTDRNIT